MAGGCFGFALSGASEVATSKSKFAVPCFPEFLRTSCRVGS